MKAVTSERMRELDRLAGDEFELPGEELMARAGQGVALLVERLADRHRLVDPFIQVIAGRGNNGGDAFVVAKILYEDDFDVELLLAGKSADVRGDALTHFSKMRTAGVPFRELASKDDWDEALAEADVCQVLVDGVLGLGVKGPPRGPAAAAIEYINRLADRALVVSIDLPSGLDADTGAAPGEVVVADVTATIGLPKQGLLLPEALPYVGTVDVVSIGIPDELIADVASPLELVTEADVRGFLPRRPRSAHKGEFGHVLLIGGAAGFAGAVSLAGRAATRAGAGRVTAWVPQGVLPLVAGTMPEVMTHAGPETETGSLSAAGWATWHARLGDFQAVAAGPGLTQHPDTATLVETWLREVKVPLVLDADALNVLRGRAAALKRAAGPVVITPHPGEMARLLSCSTAEVQADRMAAARRAAEVTGATVVLKGAGTVLAAPQGQPWLINLTGNPGMAAGGMGDVLTGIVGALLAQGLEPFAAAATGVFLHGRAGDYAAARQSQVGLTAGLVIEELPFVLRDITGR